MCNNLDKYFNNNLKCVLKLKRQLECTREVQLCNAWIERLKESDENVLRNKYLYLLGIQLRRGHLSDPFLECPPCYGKLPPLDCQDPDMTCRSAGCSAESNQNRSCQQECPKNKRMRSNCCGMNRARSVPEICSKTSQNQQSTEIRITTPMSETSYGSDYKAYPAAEYTPVNQIETCSRPQPDFGSQFKNKSEIRHFYNLMGGSGKRPEVPEYQEPQYQPSPGPGSDNMPDARQRLSINESRTGSPNNSQYLLVNEETPCSETPEETARTGMPRAPLQPKDIDAAFKRRLAEMNVIYQLRMNNLNNIIRSTKNHNETLTCQLEEIKERCRADEQCIRSLQEDNTQLKEVLETSCAERAEQRNVGQSVNQLSQRLNETLCVNDQLQQSITCLEEKIQETEQTKAEELCRIRLQQERALQELKDCNREKLMALVKDYNDKLQDMDETYKCQIKSLLDQNEANIQQLTYENDATFNEFRETTNQFICQKDAEISRLQCLLEEQCSKLESTVNDIQCKATEECMNPECFDNREKLCQMQRKLHKMQIVKDKCLRYFESKLFDILKEKHSNENTVRMLLMKQRAEITLQVFNESQLELKDAANRLQDRYKMIIKSMQGQLSQDNVDVEDLMGVKIGRVDSAGKRRCCKSVSECCNAK